MPTTCTSTRMAAFCAAMLLSLACVLAAAALVLPEHAHARSVPACAWDDYQWVDGKTTAKKIRLVGYALQNGPKPDGYILYRKAPGKKTYKKRATVRKNSWTFKYTDRKVKFAQNYSYKFRAYRKVRGKKKYGSLSKAVKMTAVNRTGKCKVKFLTAYGTETDHIDMLITSGKNNGKIVIGGGAEYFFDARTGAAEDDVDVSLELTDVSEDGSTWKEAPKKTSIAAGEKRYLRFTLEGSNNSGDISSFMFDPNNKRAEFLFDDMTYNGFNAYMTMSFTKQKAAAVINGEFYH